MNDATSHDVVILGGGLAGLTLALQLTQRLPGLDVVIIERRTHPVPQAAHKVGESSVEIAANYFGQVLGLDAHLQKTQLKKFGFRFFFSEGAERIDDVTELGASTFLTTPSYQLDRGIFENDLGAMVRARGVRFIDGATVRDVELGTRDVAHRVHYDDAGGVHAVAARWLIDATGRAGLLKRRLDLAEPNAHDANAVWFRIGARIDVDEWSDDPAWLARCNPPNRWLSTNHLVGDGYWVWLIPLASGLAFGRHRRRRDAASARHDEHVREGDELARTPPAAPAPRPAGQARPPAGLRVLPPLLVRLQAGLRRRAALGADRRGGPVPRPVLLAGRRLHRDLEHLHHRARRAGPRGRAGRAPRRAVPARLLLVLPGDAADLRRSVRPVRRSARAAGQGAVGLHVLLGRDVPAVLPAPPHRPRRDHADAEAARPCAAAERRDAALPARLERARRSAQPAADARPGRACRGSPS
jgi:2-polyprenyl-6-methoxyphenol hydroxylase-like FAD-dependent oxidoreductase